MWLARLFAQHYSFMRVWLRHCLIKTLQSLRGYNSFEGQLNIMYRNKHKKKSIKIITDADAQSLRSPAQDFTGLSRKLNWAKWNSFGIKGQSVFSAVCFSWAERQDDICYSSETVWLTEALSDVLKLPDKIPGKEIKKRSRKIEKSLSALPRGVSNVWPCSTLSAEKLNLSLNLNPCHFLTSSLVAFSLDLIQYRSNIRCIFQTCFSLSIFFLHHNE